MSFDIKGENLIAGEWVGGGDTFSSQPTSGEARQFSAATVDAVNKAVESAEAAFRSYGYTTREARAAFLETIADEIEARGEALTDVGSKETGLPEGRLNGERGRTCGQLKMFAGHIRDGAYLDRRYDEAQPDRQPAPRPDLRMMQRPIGPVAVFGASNFPLAFSTAGGDTASALAAGCPVVVKGHPAHPGTGELVAQAIEAAVKKHDLHPGVFSLVQGASNALGEALVTHPKIKAVGFTGSLKGGKALFDIAMRREEPIPVFAEMGSVNPMFVLSGAASARGAEIGKGWAGSLTMGVGQFCTNPGVAIIAKSAGADAFVQAAADGLAEVSAQTMLTGNIAEAYRSGAKRLADTTGVTAVIGGDSGSERSGAPQLFRVDAQTFLSQPGLSDEVFGPAGLVVEVADDEEMRRVAESFEGQLTVTLQMDDADEAAGKALMPIVERKAGRILANGFPTGVEVADTMVHGGPYPATTNFGGTSVGTLAIRRFLRAVCFQNLPQALLPEDLR